MKLVFRISYLGVASNSSAGCQSEESNELRHYARVINLVHSVTHYPIRPLHYSTTGKGGTILNLRMSTIG